MRRLAVTVDVLPFRVREGVLEILLIERRHDPFAGCWALPGGFIEEDETLEESARRELREETGVREIHLEQLGGYGDPGRDPRGRTVTIAFLGLTRAEGSEARADSDAAEARWFPAASPPPLAFDHDVILRHALARLRERLGWTRLAFHFLGPTFTLAEVQGLFEALLGRRVDDRAFRRRLLASSRLREIPGTRDEGSGPPALLYSLEEADHDETPFPPPLDSFR